MLSAKGWATLVSTLVILSLSIAVQKWNLLIFTLPLLYPLVLGRRQAPISPGQVVVQRRVSRSRLIEGEEFSVEVTVGNASQSTLILGIKDELAEPLRLVEGSNKGLVILKPGELKKLVYRVTSTKRGHYAVGPTRIEAYDPFLIWREPVLTYEPDEVVFLPRVVKGYRMSLSALYTIPRPGEIASKSPGEGGDFLEVREAQDKVLRRVNWKATAKTQKWMVNVFESGRLTNVLLVLDVSGKRLLGREVESYTDSLVRLAASIAFSLLTAGHRVSLLVVGNYRDWVKPGSGKRHLLRLLSALADVKHLPTRQIIDYSEVFKRISHVLSPVGSSVIVISPFTEEEALSIISTAEKMGYSVTCVAVNPFAGPRLRHMRASALLSDVWMQGILETLPRRGRRVVVVEPHE
ncbi:DUF58 domain-containing protein [Infirmifilum lucidum]|uniref:DUF58 domain-containing protein n=1 Tax=Infirmifilum lucidum TaxID=2776706 RepID=A0A7L9FHN3_9CREN|nr:DUF58 domain-containing protein [Infirmifilum lucidum]QOJ78426.1 DUF58 domain-containing protein [Infirmifilum lucidum]